MSPETNGTKIYRGKSLDDVIPKIRAELGENAIVLRRRDGLVGGVGGFFQRPFVEVEAKPGSERLDVYDEQPEDMLPEEALPGMDFEELLEDLGAEPVEFEPDIPTALEPALPLEPEPQAAPAPAAPVGDEVKRSDKAAQLVDELRDAGLSRALAEDLVAEAAEHRAPFAGSSSLRTLTRRALAARIPVAAPVGGGGRIVAFAGAGGAGKSLCAERLAAAYGAASDLAAVYVGFRTDPASAAETLAPLGVTVASADSTSEARAVVAEHGARALVVIDTPTAPKDESALATLAGQVKRIGGVEVHMALPATLSRKAAEELLGRLGAFKPARLALTHADETDHLGPAVDLAIASGVPFSFVLDGPALTPADPAKLAAGVLP
jgi:flagellar biosynthesis GTPase FlhF